MRIAVLLALCFGAIAHADLITTTQSGNLIFELIDGRGGTSNQEFGIGRHDDLGALEKIFIVHLENESVKDVTPSYVVDMGFFAAGTGLDFYNISDWGGTSYAFSSALGGSPTAQDLVVFTDADNSLGLGGSVVESLGLDHWRLHLDDAASYNIDDDDNEMIIDVRVTPVPAPSAVLLGFLGVTAAGWRLRKP